MNCNVKRGAQHILITYAAHGPSSLYHSSSKLVVMRGNIRLPMDIRIKIALGAIYDDCCLMKSTRDQKQLIVIFDNIARCNYTTQTRSHSKAKRRERVSLQLARFMRSWRLLGWILSSYYSKKSHSAPRKWKMYS